MKFNTSLLVNLCILSSVLGESLNEPSESQLVSAPKADPYLDNMIKNLEEIKRDFKDDPVRGGRANVITNLSVSDESTAKRYALLAGASYCSDGNLNAWSCGHCSSYKDFKLNKVFSESKYETRGFIGVDDSRKAIVISFRGSSNLKNWVQNIKIDKTPLLSGNNKIEVHKGFKQARDALSPLYTPVLNQLLKSKSGYKVVLVGHSLGGAIATLAAIDIQASQKLPWNRIELFTYGQPRVGNTDFAIWFDSLSLTVTRTTNNKDIVPHVPPRSFGFNHHHVELWLKDGKAKVCAKNVIEDTTCSLSTEPLLSVSDHLTYWGTRLGGSC